MSANNQILIARFKKRWYVWDNINAESWDTNQVSIKHALKSFTSLLKAQAFAYDYWQKLEWPNEAEYGVQIETLAKDGATPQIIP